MANLIDIEHLSKSYGKNKVLEDISVSFEGGDIIGLLGPNGSGKTSLIKIMTGLINDYEGSVKIDGHSPDPYTKSIVAYLPEKTYLADWMRPVDAVNYLGGFYDQQLSPADEAKDQIYVQRHAGKATAGSGNVPQSEALPARRAAWRR